MVKQCDFFRPTDESWQRPCSSAFLTTRCSVIFRTLNALLTCNGFLEHTASAHLIMHNSASPWFHARFEVPQTEVAQSRVFFQSMISLRPGAKRHILAIFDFVPKWWRNENIAGVNFCTITYPMMEVKVKYSALHQNGKFLHILKWPQKLHQ